MAITSIKRLQDEDGTTVVTWQSDKTDPTFTVYVGGVVRATGVRENVFTITPRPGEFLNVDVTDDGDVPRDAVEPSVSIEFDEVAGADHYRIEELVSGDWILRETIKAGSESPTARARLTRALADAVLTDFRVITVAPDGNLSAATALAVTIDRNPDWEGVAVAYNDGDNTLTLTAA